MSTREARRVDTSSLVWGLLFACLAGLGLWYSTTGQVNWTWVRNLSPVVLMAIGGIGLLVGRRR